MWMVPTIGQPILHLIPHQSYLQQRLTQMFQNPVTKAFLQTSLERNFTNSLYIFILSVNFKNLTVKLHVLIIFFMLAKF